MSIDDYLKDAMKMMAPVLEAATELFSALTKESKIRAALVLAELEEVEGKAQQAEQDAEKAKGAVGMMATPYGYCATCGEANMLRKPLPAGDRQDVCPAGHIHPVSESLCRPPKPESSGD
jgi:hypothetical protein